MTLTKIIKRLAASLKDASRAAACGLYMGAALQASPRITLPDVRLEPHPVGAVTTPAETSRTLDIRIPYSAFAQSPHYFPPIGPNLIQLKTRPVLDLRIPEEAYTPEPVLPPIWPSGPDPQFPPPSPGRWDDEPKEDDCYCPCRDSQWDDIFFPRIKGYF